MKFSRDELFGLTTETGGRFSVNSVNDAYAFCKKLTTSHYENFPVASFLIPGKQRKHIYPIYAFARIADDIADELTTEPVNDRLNALSEMNSLLKTRIIKGNPVFIALQSTMCDYNIPELPFQKLLIAFKKDVCFTQPETMEELADYCSYSANPVGELILRLFNLYDKKTAELSDNVCTALQLINFWQDISVDLQTQRIYIPKKNLIKYGIEEQDLFSKKKSANFNLCLNELFDFTDKCLNDGSNIVNYLPVFRLRAEISATIHGGRKMLEKCRESGVKLIDARPKLRKTEMLKILYKSLFL